MLDIRDDFNVISEIAVVDKNAIIEPPVRIYRHAIIAKNTKIGSFSYVNNGTTIFNGTSIGRYCSIGKNCEIGTIDHPMDWLSSSPIQYKISRQFPFYKEFCKDFPQIKKHFPKHTIIGNDVWIGSLVVVKRGVTIGDGAVLGAGAIVTKDVPPYAIVAGVPAKVVRFRFSENIIKDLLELKWWEMGLCDLKEVKFDNIEEAILQIKSIRNVLNNKEKRQNI